MAKNKSKQVNSSNFLKPSVLLALAFALLFGGLGGYFIGNSDAATPDSVSGPFQLCLNSAPSYCIQTHGTGDNTNGQAAVHTGTGTTFYKQSDGKYGKYAKYLLKNGAGKCLHTFGGGEYVNVAKCDSSATSEQWAQTKSSPYKWINVYSTEVNKKDYFLATNGAGNNDPVYSIPPQGGTWWSWKEK